MAQGIEENKVRHCWLAECSLEHIALGCIEWHGSLRCVSTCTHEDEGHAIGLYMHHAQCIHGLHYMYRLQQVQRATYLFGVWSSLSRNPNIMGTQIPFDGRMTIRQLFLGDMCYATGLTTTRQSCILHVSLIALHPFCSAGGVRRIGNDQIVGLGESPSSAIRPRQSPLIQVFHFHGATWDLKRGTETLQDFGYLTTDKSASQISRKG